MTRFIKIFTTLAGLTLMTACGNTQGLIDALTNAVSNTDRTAAACIQNPFNEICDGNATYESTRDTIERSCIANPNVSDNCVNFVTFICRRDNPYHEICTKDGNDYSTIQNEITEGCIADGTGQHCPRAIAAICTQDPFDRLCLTDLANQYNQGASPSGEVLIGFSAARARVCNPTTGSAPDSPQCTTLVTTVCNRDPLDAVCAGHAEYFVARDNACWIQGRDGGTRTTQCDAIYRENNLASNAIPACRENYVNPTGANRFNPRCYNVVIGVCNDNPFDVLCDQNTNYLELHADIITACTDEEPDATFCVEAKTSVCADNPFHSLCLISYTANTNDYTSERQAAVNDCQTIFVAGARCEGAAGQFCVGKTLEDDLFNPLCLAHPGTDTSRRTTCVNEKVAVETAGGNPFTARCVTTATRICDATPLDPLCEDVATYRSAQFGACVLTPTHASCANGAAQFSYITPIIECLESPFSATCLDPDTVSGAAFALHARVAQDAYCESGGPRTASTNVETRADRVNCTNIGSSPVFADLARNITQNGITTYNSGGVVTANGVSESNPNIGGFLRAGVFGAKLGIHTGNHGNHLPNGGTYDQNTGNFTREIPAGRAWTGFADGYGGSRDRIWEVASKADPKDGFTYFFAEDDGGNFLTYAGIWQTTNFGAPLALRPVDSNGNNITAIWQGNFTAYAGGGAPNVVLTVVDEAQPGKIYRRAINSVTTPFYVDFTAGTFNVHNTVADDGTGAVYGYNFGGGVGSQAEITKRIVFDVDGVFGAGVVNAGRTLNPGELSGTVTRTLEAANYAPSNGDLTFATDPSPLEMPLTGLIGVEGALGIFLNPAANSSPQVGGFTATAPTN